MKRILKCFIICTTLASMWSCEDYMDVHKEFIEGGEIIYAPKTDSVAFIAGNERILCRLWLNNSPNVSSIDLYWNTRADSLIIPVTPSFGLDSFEVIIPGLEEKSYTFDIRTTDNFGHKSLWTSAFGNTYGDLFLETLMERRIRDTALGEQGGTITFYMGIESMVRTEVSYQTNAGETNIISTSRTDNVVYCPDAKIGSKFRYRSLFIPESEAIDTFALAWQESEIAFPDVFLFDKSNWEVLSVSDETASDGGGKNTLLDNDKSTYWHSQWDGGNAPLPHWAVIDMKTPKQIVRIDTYRRQGNTDAKDIEYFVGPDPDPNAATWTKIGAGQYPGTIQDLLTINIESSVNTQSGRYLKCVLPTSNREVLTSIAEIDVYGGEN